MANQSIKQRMASTKCSVREMDIGDASELASGCNLDVDAAIISLVLFEQ